MRMTVDQYNLMVNILIIGTLTIVYQFVWIPWVRRK